MSIFDKAPAAAGTQAPNFKIKDQTIEAWQGWLNEQLTPPIEVPEELQDVLEAFREACEQLKQCRDKGLV